MRSHKKLFLCVQNDHFFAHWFDTIVKNFNLHVHSMEIGGSIVGRLKDNSRTYALGPFPVTPAEQARSGETCIRWTATRQQWEL